MLALCDAVKSGRIPNAEVAVVISDQSSAAGIQLAKDRGIKTEVVERNDLNRVEHDRQLAKTLEENKVDLVCLAGYMRVLSPEFVNAFRGRILNIHPSLLPLFRGLEAQKQAVENNAKQSGCTVHFVDETLDGGPTITQATVPVYEDDTPETLSARILMEEHRLYTEAVNMVLSGAVTYEQFVEQAAR